MTKYNWTYATIGGTTRVKIQSGEDIRHLGELDEKLWTVLSCPVTGLEIAEESLQYIDLRKDGNIHVNEVVETAEWLCSVLKDPQVLLNGEAQLRLEDIADTALRTTADKISENGIVTLETVQAAISHIDIPCKLAPESPYPAEIIAAYKACQATYTDYYEKARLQAMGLATLPEDTVVPKMNEEDFKAMGAAIADYENQTAAIAATHDNAVAQAQAEYLQLQKLLLLCRDFYTLLRNFVSFQDFYQKHLLSPIGKSEDGCPQAIFQAGTLVIDQRACHLCLRVNDMAKHDAQAAASGMFLIYCNCIQKVSNEKMQIVAAMTVGDIRNLKVGKNALFYDRQGQDWEAEVVKIVDNPISITQAFWSPYRKLGDWITNLINKSAADKENKVFSEATAKIQENAAKPADEKAKMQPFDIAKFAGIFAAIGMAIGYIGAFFTSLGKGLMGLADRGWWMPILAIVGLMLIISGPAMIVAWFKLRKRNLSPLLNANGWAVNANALVNVLFGSTLTDQAQFPLLKPKGLSKGKKGAIIASIVLVVVAIAVALILLFGCGYCPCKCC